MVRKNEFPTKRGGNHGGYSGRPQRSQEQNSSKAPDRPQTEQRTRNYPRDNYSRQAHSNHNAPARHTRNRGDETVDDIKNDILRIEKEIDLELKEIRSLRLGL